MAKARFEWDPKKDWENQEKHGVPFAIAQFAFADPRRVIAEDLPMNLRPKAAPTFPLPLGEGGPKGQVRERPPVHGRYSWQRRG